MLTHKQDHKHREQQTKGNIVSNEGFSRLALRMKPCDKLLKADDNSWTNKC